MGWFRRTFVVTLCLASILSGCGRGNVGAVQDQSIFLPYVEKFEEESHNRDRELYGSARTVTIRFGKPSQEAAYGECRWHIIDGKEIVIHEDRWSGLSESSRRALIFHELGHCVLDRKHDDDTKAFTDNGQTFNFPESVMNPVLLSGSVYEHFREYYDAELFRK